MSDDRPEAEEGRVNPYRLSWPPSPRMQIVLIAIGFGLLNLLLVVIWGVALFVTR